MEQLTFAGFEKEKSTDWKWSFKDYPPKNGLKVFSCFSCGGGSTMGYKLVGCDVIGNCEIDPAMNEIYVKNHNPKYNYLMDIREFNKLENLPEELYNLDILDGSPPCTTFSMAGCREDSWGKKKKFREGQTEQTLDDLAFVFIETANKLKPKCVIMENVEGLLLGAAWSYVQRIYKELSDIGYSAKHYLCKGENMGIPQKRHRVFFIAFRNDINFDFNKLDMNFNYEPITYGEIKTGDVKRLKKESKLYRLLTAASKGDGSLKNASIKLYNKASFFNETLCYYDDVVPTIRTKPPISYQEKGYISNKSIINAQTFPKDYNFNNKNVCYICGMSVPPVMIKRIVKRIINTGALSGKTAAKQLSLF